MIESERERQSSRFVQQTSYSFQDNEGRAATDSERKRIPDSCSREAKGTTTILFSFQGGDAESYVIRRRMQRPRTDIDMDAFSQVLRGSASHDLIAETSYFVLNSMLCGEPVQLLENTHKHTSIYIHTLSLNVHYLMLIPNGN